MFVELTNLLFGPDALGDVGASADPLPDRPVFLQYGDAMHSHVAILSILPAHAIFGVVETPAADRPRPDVVRSFAIVGMKSIDPSEASDFVRRLAGEHSPQRYIPGEF